MRGYIASWAEIPPLCAQTAFRGPDTVRRRRANTRICLAMTLTGRAGRQLSLYSLLVCWVTCGPTTTSGAGASGSRPTVIVWLDNDSGNNSRPDHGWWPMNPNDPYTVPPNGQWRTMTSKLGLYSSLDPAVAR